MHFGSFFFQVLWPVNEGTKIEFLSEFFGFIILGKKVVKKYVDSFFSKFWFRQGAFGTKLSNYKPKRKIFKILFFLCIVYCDYMPVFFSTDEKSQKRDYIVYQDVKRALNSGFFLLRIVKVKINTTNNGYFEAIDIHSIKFLSNSNSIDKSFLFCVVLICEEGTVFLIFVEL